MEVQSTGGRWHTNNSRSSKHLHKMAFSLFSWKTWNRDLLHSWGHYWESHCDRGLGPNADAGGTKSAVQLYILETNRNSPSKSRQGSKPVSQSISKESKRVQTKSKAQARTNPVSQDRKSLDRKIDIIHIKIWKWGGRRCLEWGQKTGHRWDTWS